MQKINEVFTGNVAELVQANPLGRTSAEDVQKWNYEENGCYSVMSAYRLLAG